MESPASDEEVIELLKMWYPMVPPVTVSVWAPQLTKKPNTPYKLSSAHLLSFGVSYLQKKTEPQ